MKDNSKTLISLLTLILTVVFIFNTSQKTNAASPTIEISNIRVQGDSIPYNITCGNVISLDPGFVLDMDITATDTDPSDMVMLTVQFSPSGIETVNFNPVIPVSGNPAATHLNYFYTQFYFGIMSIYAEDLLGNITQCDLYIDSRLSFLNPYIVISNPTKNGLPLSNLISGSTIQAMEGDIIDFDITGVYDHDFILSQEFTPGPSPIPGVTFTPSIPGAGNRIFISHFHLEPQTNYLGNMKLLLTASNGLTSECIINFDLVLPVEMTSFFSIVNGNNVTLNWTTGSENNNSRFEIYRTSGSTQNWNVIGTVPGSGTSSAPKSYSYADRNINSGSYSYRLKQIDFNGNFEYHYLSNEVVIRIPVKFNISQNYPNPFNPSTKIDFEIPEDGEVNIVVYDISGMEVSVLVNGFRIAGYYSVLFNASDLSSGIYYYKVQFNGDRSYQKVMKMAFVK